VLHTNHLLLCQSASVCSFAKARLFCKRVMICASHKSRDVICASRKSSLSHLSCKRKLIAMSLLRKRRDLCFTQMKRHDLCFTQIAFVKSLLQKKTDCHVSFANELHVSATHFEAKPNNLRSLLSDFTTLERNAYAHTCVCVCMYTKTHTHANPHTHT